jgi:phenylalanyl-tRNA synthetase alpha chain
MTDSERKELEKTVESLSVIEKKIIHFLESKNVNELSEKSNLEKTSVLRALQFLSNKNIVSIKQDKKQVVDLATNGVVYLKSGLPERRLVNTLIDIKKPIELRDLKNIEKQTKLNKNEIMVSIGELKHKGIIDVSGGKITLKTDVKELIEKFPEELFLECLPKDVEILKKEEINVMKTLQKRKQIIEVVSKSETNFTRTQFGKKVLEFLKNYSEKEFIESLNPEIINEEKWKGKIFRRYDVESNVPKIYGGKRHFMNQSVDYARKIWSEMGFEEMSGNLTQSSFWNFDALFTAQDHPVREMQDTFFIKEIKAKLPEKEVVKKVKQAHEKGIDNSKGWQYSWDENEAKRMCLRTHNTVISAITLSNLTKKELPKKFFAIGKCFRNETLDLNHLFELTQTEGIVIDKNANLKHLIGYLTEFYKKMGYEKVRIRPGYFPYTEPSLEVEVYDKNQKKWIELGGAGIFRPEVVIPLLGEYIPVLAWGQGFERIIREYFKIKDIRDIYKNDIKQIREMKAWLK